MQGIIPKANIICVIHNGDSDYIIYVFWTAHCLMAKPILCILHPKNQTNTMHNIINTNCAIIKFIIVDFLIGMDRFSKSILNKC